MKKPYIIADIGANWRRTNNEDKNKHIACGQIEEAAWCGVDAVKFQLFTHEELYGLPGDNLYALPRQWLADLKDKADRVGVEFMCSAFSPEGVDIVDRFVNIHKIASSEMKHVLMLEKVKATEKPVIISTGAAYSKEIHWLLDKEGMGFDPHKVTLLECVAAYPANAGDYHLGLLHNWHRRLGVQVGLSDHTKDLDNLLGICAVGAGAVVFEKHFDALGLNYGLTPDTPVSLTAKEMRIFVGQIQRAYDLMQNRAKRPTFTENDIVHRHKRRLIATQRLNQGDILKLGENYGIFRAEKNDYRGSPPEDYPKFEGKAVSRNVFTGQPLGPTDLECPD